MAELIALEDLNPETRAKMVDLTAANMKAEMRARSMAGYTYEVTVALETIATDKQIISTGYTNLNTATNRKLVAKAQAKFEDGHEFMAKHHFLLNDMCNAKFAPEVLQAVVAEALQRPDVQAEMPRTREGGR